MASTSRRVSPKRLCPASPPPLPLPLLLAATCCCCYLLLLAATCCCCCCCCCCCLLLLAATVTSDRRPATSDRRPATTATTTHCCPGAARVAATAKPALPPMCRAGSGWAPGLVCGRPGCVRVCVWGMAASPPRWTSKESTIVWSSCTSSLPSPAASGAFDMRVNWVSGGPDHIGFRSPG